MRKVQPRIDLWLRKAEKYARHNDAWLRYTIGILAFLLVLFVAMDMLITTTPIQWVGGTCQYHTGTLSDVSIRSRSEKRVLHRVRQIMRDQCELDTSQVLFASQVHVRGKPYNKTLARICFMEMDLINPYVVATGTDSVVCQDEHEGETKMNNRAFPITLSNMNGDPEYFTMGNASDVCTVMMTVDVLGATW